MVFVYFIWCRVAKSDPTYDKSITSEELSHIKEEDTSEQYVYDYILKVTNIRWKWWKFK